MCVYFVFHAITGERGVLNYFRSKTLLQEKIIELIKIESEFNKLQNDVRFLSPNSVSLDYLEEQLKKELSLVGDGESIIILQN